MSDQSLNMFRYVVGAAQPLRLLVSREGERNPETVEIDAPYGIIGRASAALPIASISTKRRATAESIR